MAKRMQSDDAAWANENCMARRHGSRELSRRQGILKAAELEKQGIAERCLRMGALQGFLVKVGPGMYVDREVLKTIPDGFLEIGMLEHRAPKAWLCGPTAAAIHGTLPAIFFSAPCCIGLPLKSRAPSGFKHVRRFSPNRADSGLMRMRAFNVTFQLSEPHRSVAELFLMRNTLGERLARFALRNYIGKAAENSVEDVIRIGRSWGLTRVIESAYYSPITGELTNDDLYSLWALHGQLPPLQGWVPPPKAPIY